MQTTIEHQDYLIFPAVTVKDKFAVKCLYNGKIGYKTRASRLAAGLSKNKYSYREHAFLMSLPVKERFVKLYAEGWDAEDMTFDLISPTGHIIRYGDQ